MPVAFQMLETARVTQMVAALQDVRQVPQSLVFYNRTPMTPAVDSEVLARFVGYIPVADLVADDQRAAVYSTGKIQFESTNIPNIKIGTGLTQEFLNMLQSIAGNPGLTNDGGLLRDRLMLTLDELLLGIRQRCEGMIVGMHIDSFSYDRFGIKLTGATWGMPADFKVTTAVAWDTAATADGVADLLLQQRYANVRYGKMFTRATMSTAAFNYLTAQTAFQNRAKATFFGAAIGATIPIQSMGMMRPIVENLTGMQIELYDARYWQQNTDGTNTSYPYMPINKVILSNPENDNNAQIMDMANAVVTETIVSSMTGNNMIGGGFAGPQRGPVAYFTAPADLNPPQINGWAVARGFPRKKQLQATSVLTVGSFSDPIPTSAPF